MSLDRLLAKSYRRDEWPNGPPDFALLTQHTRDVVEAGTALVDRVGLRALTAAGLPAETLSTLRQAVVLNTLIQDFGKANSHYQEMVGGNPERSQLLRHETISGLLVTGEGELASLFASVGREIFYPALWGALGHHRKFSDRHWRPREAESAHVHLGHADFRAILAEAVRELAKVGVKLPESPRLLTDIAIGSGRGDSSALRAAKLVTRLLDECESWSDEHDRPDFRRFVALVKAFGIAADVCGSAVARVDHTQKPGAMASFVSKNLSVGMTPRDLDQLVWRWAWENATEIESKPGVPTGFPPDFEQRGFQKEAEMEAWPLAFVMAGCGSGKSLAAYLWGRRWCQKWAKLGRDGFRLVVTLPTTGTTTEHFKDYALHCGLSADQIGLTHSRSSVDLAFMAETAPQEEEGDGARSESDPRNQAEQMLAAQQAKIDSLALWGTPLVVATADTVLGLMANARKPVYSFPALMQSAIVFDEVHAYDDDLFGHLLAFLENFPGIPVMLMTASLPGERKEALRKVRRDDLKEIPGPTDLEGHRRYATPEIIAHEDHDEVWDRIRTCLKGPRAGKVLWVRNQVCRVNESYRECFDRLSDLDPWIGVYHSRFRYKDRVRVHRRVIDEFRRKDRTSGAVLVASQVAEMSLNLSADLLVTDLATIPAMIQRYGRLARYPSPDNPQPLGRSVVCELPTGRGESPDYLPYDPTEVELAREWMSELVKLDRPLSQQDLLEKFAHRRSGRTFDLRTARQRAVFFSGLWQTYPASTRAAGYTLAVVLEDDAKGYWASRPRDKKFDTDWLREHEVSIPIRKEMEGWPVFGYTRVAPRVEVGYGNVDHVDPKERTGAAWLTT